MEAKIIEIITMESIAIMLFVFAYAIGVMKKLELIAGYNERTSHQVKDKDGLARLVARVCLLVGLASALMPLATHIWGTRGTGFTMCVGAYGGFIAGVVALTMLQAHDYTLSGKERRAKSKAPGLPSPEDS